MQEVKKPRKPLIYYYVIVLIILLLFNFLLMPWMAERRVQEVGYDEFIEVSANEEIGQVQINEGDNEIIFTNRDGERIYKTGMVEDPGMTERLYESGARFSGQIMEQASPILIFLLTWILPIVIFIGIGQYMSNKLMSRKRTCPRLWTTSIIPENIRKSVPPCRRGSFSSDLPEPVRPCWRRRSQERRTSRSSPCQDRNSWKCS